jgi:hypothetical protein
MIQQYVRILLILGMAAVICGTVSAAMGIVAETHETSGVDAPVCSPPCQCMAETTAIAQWGVNGYEMCSKTICGQSADANVQYHCIHPIAGTSAVATNPPAQVPVQSPALPAAASPVAAGITQKSPVGMVIILAGIGVALLAAAGLRRK